jgi:TRAP transporter TAXI family solute receptor
MANESIQAKEKRRGIKGHLGIFGPGIIITLIGFIVAYQFVEPAPPRTITIGTGDKSGAYYAFAQRYREILARDGIALEIRSTAGSMENVKLVAAKEGGVDIAFVQGGIGDPSAQPGLQSLASLYFEPLWVFHQRDLKIKRLPDLQGKKIAVGPEASGTSAIATKLLASNGIKANTATLLPLGGEKAVEALLGKKADAVFLSSPRSLPSSRICFSGRIFALSASKGGKPISGPIVSCRFSNCPRA